MLGGRIPMMNERRQSQIDYYFQRLEYWQEGKPHGSTPRLMAARDADEAHPLRSEEEATEVVEYLLRLEREQAAAEAATAVVKNRDMGC
ncbi:MAG: hypothetical protein M3348_09900 [Acidobacteriota bacterium]|nr:hypothetical protein [Acidobacteriota bacterium]